MKGNKTPAAEVSIYTELSTAVGGIAPNDGEEKTAFLIRLTEAVAELDDSQYDALSNPAQKWFNTSGEAINANIPENIPNLPGAPDFAKATSKDDSKTETPAPKSNHKESQVKDKNPTTKPIVKSTAKSVTPAKATPAATSAKKTTKKAASRGRVAANADGDAIKVLVKDNPKRAGSESFKRFALYAKNKTVGAFLKAGGTRSDLRWDSENKFISIG